MDISLINSLISGLTDFVPRFLGALIVIIIGWILANFIRRITRIGLKKTKIDNLAEKLRQIEIISKSNIEIVPSKVIAYVLYYIVLIVVLLIAADMLKLPALSSLLQEVIHYLPNLLVAMAIIVIGTLIADAARKVIYTAGKSLGISSIRMISSIVFYFLFITIVFSALDQAGIKTNFLQNSITTIIGGVVLAFGLGYGLASKDILSNFLSGYYNASKLKVGNRIKIGEQDGIIEEIDKMSITIIQGERKIIIPLKKLNEEMVTIYTDTSSN